MDLNPYQSNFPMHTAKIAKLIQENYRIKTFELVAKISSYPGQFIMIWLPRMGERPMSLGGGNPVTFTIAAIGKFSEAMHQLKEGDPVSFRGPLGTHFMLPEKAKTIAVVGGGYGVVPMAYLAKEAKKKSIRSIAVIGSRTEKDVIFENHFKEFGEVHVTTDDGSYGRKGNVMAALEELITHHRFDAVYACGPEMMMYNVARFAQKNKIPSQVSVERYMKCGINICGACDINGKTTCNDGPIFTGEQALQFSEFGKTHRDACGIKQSF
ncbi:MAG TPA: dihydroorotate dehydrogenase electron transfer subunit [Candidatus Bilamarchaeaceae archaeon]|nr:dihydroorotate dehydrogenase electron transfer subunit [Candidatus Bilamarchaeaceae archaeon]